MFEQQIETDPNKSELKSSGSSSLAYDCSQTSIKFIHFLSLDEFMDGSDLKKIPHVQHFLNTKH